MTKQSGIYKITNTINGKFYIGSSSDIGKRIWAHHNDLNQNIHCNCHLQNAWNKYGEQVFEFKVVLLCDLENKLYYEQILLDGLKPAYNIAVCAEASQQGLHPSDATRAKLSAINRGKCRTEEAKHKMSEAAKGKSKSESHKRKLSELNKGERNPNFGKHLSEETRMKIGEAAKGNTRCRGFANALGHKHTEETRRQISDAATQQWAKRKAEAQMKANAQ